MELIKKEFLNAIIDNLDLIKIVAAFVSYSVLEYYLGKTDRVAEGSVLEFTWARVKGLFSPSKGVPGDDKS